MRSFAAVPSGADGLLWFKRWLFNRDNAANTGGRSRRAHHIRTHRKSGADLGYFFSFQDRTYSTLNVDGRSLSSGIPNHWDMISLSKIMCSG
jgi:hypothetical protein